MNALPEYKRFLKSILSLLILVVLSVNVCGLDYGDFRYGENHLRRKHSAEVEVLLDVDIPWARFGEGDEFVEVRCPVCLSKGEPEVPGGSSGEVPGTQYLIQERLSVGHG